MTIARIGKPSDATWQRAWEVADAAELATLMGTYLDPLGPKRGDIIVQLDDGIYYQVVTANVVKPVNLLEIDNTWLGDNAFDNGISEYSRTVNQGVWQDEPYDAANYSGLSGMTWSVSAGQAAVNRYATVGNILFWNFSVVAGVVGGTPSQVLVATLPGGFSTVIYQDFTAAYIEDAGVAAAGFSFSPGAGTEIYIVKFAATNYTAGNVSVDFNIQVEIAP